MTKRILSVAMFLGCFSYSQASIQFESSTTGGFLVRDNDAAFPLGTPLLAASTSTVGFFAQLILDVAGDGPDATSSLTGGVTGVSGDDVVVDVAFFGSNRGVNPLTDGRMFRQNNDEPHIDGGKYFVRVWNAPAPSTFTLTNGTNENTPIPAFNPLTGLNSAGKLLRYGDSAIFTATGASTASNILTFQARATVPYAVVIPEPTTAGLLGMGMLGVIAALRKRKQQA